MYGMLFAKNSLLLVKVCCCCESSHTLVKLGCSPCEFNENIFIPQDQIKQQPLRVKSDSENLSNIAGLWNSPELRKGFLLS